MDDPYAVLKALTEVLARAYLRVSKDRSGVAKSVGQTNDVLAADCESRGWKYGASYSDNSKSASRYSRDVRGDFDQLIGDLEGDRFGARVLLLWESSRGSRRVDEWVRLIDLCELRKVYFWVHTHNRLYDPANPRDRRTLLEDAVDSEYESGKTSARTRRDMAASAREGRPQGQIPFGYRRLYNDRTGKLIRQELDPDTAPLVKELFERYLEGVSLNDIAREWAERGVRSKGGKRFSPEHLRTLLRRPCYAGLRVHLPGVSGGGSRKITEKDLYPAQWAGIVTQKQWRDVVKRMRAAGEAHADKDRQAPRDGKAEYLLTYIARCAPCGGPMSARQRSNTVMAYGCHDLGCVSLLISELDEYIEDILLTHLENPRVIREIRARSEQEDERVDKLTADIGRWEALIAELEDQVAEEKMTAGLAGAIERKNLKKIKEAREEIQRLTIPSALVGMIAPGADVRQRWADAPMSARRITARAMFTPEQLGQIRIVGGKRGVRTPAQDRVTLYRPSNHQAAG